MYGHVRNANEQSKQFLKPAGSSLKSQRSRTPEVDLDQRLFCPENRNSYFADFTQDLIREFTKGFPK